MAIVDKYVDANNEAGKLATALTTFGQDAIVAVATVAVVSGDDDTSVYRLFKSLPSNLVPVKITVQNTAVTGGTDYDLGIYKVNGAVIDKDILADGVSMATARTIAVDNNVGMTTIAIADGVKTLQELAQTADAGNNDNSYDLALTANTVGTADGTIKVTAWFVSK